MNLNEVLTYIISPLKPVVINNNYIYDGAFLTLTCSKHVHKYLIYDIVNTNLKCKTCNYGNKFVKFVREIVEEYFIVEPSDENSYEFFNPNLKINIICNNKVGIASVETGEWLRITFHKTSSVTQIKKLLYIFLSNKDLPCLIKDKILNIKHEVFKKKMPLPKTSKSIDELEIKDTIINN
jgi:hypothetical protein